MIFLFNVCYKKIDCVFNDWKLQLKNEFHNNNKYLIKWTIKDN